MTIAGHTVRLRFAGQGTGLVLKAVAVPYLQGFAVVGADRWFRWAPGAVEGDAVGLRCPAGPAPVAVRYAWGNLPFLSLYNREGLPAPPFRTDAWPGLTAGRK